MWGSETAQSTPYPTRTEGQEEGMMNKGHVKRTGELKQKKEKIQCGTKVPHQEKGRNAAVQET